MVVRIGDVLWGTAEQLLYRLRWGGRGRALGIKTSGNSFVAVLRHG